MCCRPPLVVAIQGQAPLEVVSALVEPCRKHRQQAGGVDEGDTSQWGLTALTVAIQMHQEEVVQQVRLQPPKCA